MKKLKSIIIELLEIAFAAAVFSLGVHCFISPNNIAPGGVTGASIILVRFFDIGVGTFILLLNIPLLIIGFIFLERSVMLKTLYAVALITVFTDIMEMTVPAYDAGSGNGIIAAIFGGAAMGAGMGLIYKSEATSGGADILTKIIGKYFPQYRLGVVQAALDIIVVAAGFAVFGELNGVLLAVIAIFIQSYLIDRILYGGRESRLLLIFSKKNDEIAGKIIRADHGVTFLNAKGAFSKEERTVVMTAVRRSSYEKIKRIVREADPSAFLITTNANEVLGLGFEKLI